MTKRLDPRISGLSFDKEDHPGCLWGVLHALRSYQWQHVKKMMPNKRICSSRKHAGGTRYSRLRSNIPDNSNAQGSFDAEVDDINIIERPEICQSKSGSCKVHMNSVIAEEISKEQDDKCPLPNFRSHFKRTDSIHHLEPSNYRLPDAVREDSNCPIIGLPQADGNTPESPWDPFLLNTPGVPGSFRSGCELCNTTTSLKNLSHDQLDELGRQLLDNALLQKKLERAKEAFSRQKSMDVKESPKDVASYRSKEANVNNGLFQRNVLGPNYALAHHLPGVWTSKAKRGLIKSESFPVDDSSSKKSTKTSKLEYMQKDVKFFDDGAVSAVNQDQENPDAGETSTTSSAGPHVDLKKRRFKGIKQRIKKAIKESRKERHRISMDAIFHKLPHGSRFSKDPKGELTDKLESVINRVEQDSLRSDDEDKNPTPILKKIEFGRIRRTQSLHESLDRYSQLFELSFGSETKQHLSGSLKLANESGASSSGSAPKSFGRILSLPDLESYCSLQCDESGVVLTSGRPTRVLLDSNTTIGSLDSTEQNTGLTVRIQNHTQSDAFTENGELEKLESILDPMGNRIAIKDEIINDVDNLTNRECSSISECEQEIGPDNNANTKQAQPSPISVLYSCFQDSISSPTKLSISEGSEFKPKQSYVDELDSLENFKDQSVMDSFSGAISTADLEKVNIPSKHFPTDFRHVHVDKKDEADFNYVRDVLKLSGFSGNEFLGTWYSPDQPVDPSLFEEVETSSPLKSDYSGDEVSSNYDHQLLFDIINEVLQEIHDRSFTYWPWPLSCNCHIRPPPTGYHVLEEVWTIISWYLNSQPELEPLDYLVVRDLSKSDGWMNLQFESECVSLELEDMILDDLLEEVIHA